MASAHSSWQDRVVVITGASGGLGKALAAEFARRGAQVVMAARGEESLRQAADEISQAGGKTLPVVCDVTEHASVAALFEQVQQEFGRIDVLVNNVGLSTRREVTKTTVEQMQEMLEVNFLSMVRCTQAALPVLRESSGHLVNIGSLASKVGTRYLGAYPASKHAVAAYSQQLRLELADAGVHVLLVCPGPIARDGPRSYGAEDNADLPAAAARPGGGAKVKAIDPTWLARKIIRACERRKPELVAPWKARLLFALAEMFPSLGDRLLKKMT